VPALLLQRLCCIALRGACAPRTPRRCSPGCAALERRLDLRPCPARTRSVFPPHSA